MSLINEALKKAQRQRTVEQAAVEPPMPGNTGGAVTPRRQPRSANVTLLIASGAIALVVLSVVITVFLLNRPAKTPSVAAATTPVPAATPTSEPAPAPSIVMPAIPSPAPATKSEPPPAAPVTSAALPPPEPAKPVASPPEKPAPEPAAPKSEVTPVPPTPVATPPAPAVKPDERIHAYVDALRVGGIRSSGTESRVLMNDRVFRVNDIVDRTLGVRLVKVDTDSLTFTDARGAIYVKYF